MDFKNDTKLSGGCELNFRDTTDRWYNEVDSYTNYDKGCVRKKSFEKSLNQDGVHVLLRNQYGQLHTQHKLETTFSTCGRSWTNQDNIC